MGELLCDCVVPVLAEGNGIKVVRTRTITKCVVPWFWSVQPECTRSIGHVEFPKCQTRIFVEWKEPKELHIKLQKYNMGHILNCNCIIYYA